MSKETEDRIQNDLIPMALNTLEIRMQSEDEKISLKAAEIVSEGTIFKKAGDTGNIIINFTPAQLSDGVSILKELANVKDISTESSVKVGEK